MATCKELSLSEKVNAIKTHDVTVKGSWLEIWWRKNATTKLYLENHDDMESDLACIISTIVTPNYLQQDQGNKDYQKFRFSNVKNTHTVKKL